MKVTSKGPPCWTRSRCAAPRPACISLSALWPLCPRRWGVLVDDKIVVPPEVLAVFKAIQRVVDATVDMLEAPTDSVIYVQADDEMTLSDQHVSVDVHQEFGISMVVDAVVIPKFVDMPTVPEVRMARAWYEANKTIIRVGLAVGGLESLLQFAERILNIRHH